MSIPPAPRPTAQTAVGTRGGGVMVVAAVVAWVLLVGSWIAISRALRRSSR